MPCGAISVEENGLMHLMIICELNKIFLSECTNKLICIYVCTVYVHACIGAYSIRACMYVYMCIFMHVYDRAQANLDFQCSNIH